MIVSLSSFILMDMGKRSHVINVENLSRILLYVLGRRPDEFGLVPDREGFVKYKELLQAFHEEPDWRYVRQSHINEVLIGHDRHLFEAEETRIRVLERKWRLDPDTPAQEIPPVLFIAVRRRAHPVAMENGLKGNEGRYLVLSPNRDMALRIGRRRDQNPVLLEVVTRRDRKKRPLFYAFGDLFVGLEIPSSIIVGPPVPKEKPVRDQEKRKKGEQINTTQENFSAGTFLLETARDPDRSRKARGKKPKGWKEAARKAGKSRRQKPRP